MTDLADKEAQSTPLIDSKEKGDVEAPAGPKAEGSEAPPLHAQLINEFIGTFFLVLQVYLGVAQVLQKPEFTNAGFAIGTMLAVMIYQGGHISGAHYNPAVTMGVLMSGRGLITAKNAVFFILTQLVGGLCAAFTGLHISDKPWGPAPSLDFGFGRAITVETIFTMALVTIVLNVATAETTAKNNYYGYAIGFLVFVGATATGGISGAVFNPAVGTTIDLVDISQGGTSEMWVYWVGPMLGSALAAGFFRITNPAEYIKK